MTIEQLLDLPAAGLEGLTDEQLVTYLSPYFKFTRPENVVRSSVVKPTLSKSKVSNAIAKMDMMKMTPEKLKLMREMAGLLGKSSK